MLHLKDTDPDNRLKFMWGRKVIKDQRFKQDKNNKM